jgi:predicted DNA-binding transcriptional regulator YafY
VSRLERLLNLAAALSHTERPLTFAEIRARVPGYIEGDSGRRAFERDKDQLRDLGFDLVPQRVGVNETGYRLEPDDWSMGVLDLEPDEAAALALAASVARMEGDSSGGNPGMRAAARLSPLVSDRAEALVTAQLGMTSPAHPIAADAVARRRVLRFRYRAARDHDESSAGPQERTLEPYGLVLRNGRWYVVGRDVVREAIRAFRLDRIEGEPEAGEPGAFSRPPDFQPAEAVPTEPWSLAEPRVTATLLLDASAAWWTRPHLGDTRVIEERDDGSVVVEVEVAMERAFLGFVASLLDAAEILGPPELRARLVAHAASVASR